MLRVKEVATPARTIICGAAILLDYNVAGF
jgi:hypothetical protein